MNERRPSPDGSPAVRGRPISNLEAARKLQEILRDHKELHTTEIPFMAGDQLVQEGVVSQERYAYLVIEGTLVEETSRYSPDHGRQAFPIREIHAWGIGFAQALSASTAGLPARAGLVAKTDGRAFQIDADWLTTLSKLDKIGLMIAGVVQGYDQLMTALIEERTYRVIDKGLNAIVSDFLSGRPQLHRTPEEVKALLAQKLVDGKTSEKKLANAEIQIAEIETALKLRIHEIQSLKRQLAESEARARTANEGSANAFAYIEAEQERQARSAANTWRLLEAEFRRIPNFQLSPALKAAMLGLDLTDDRPVTTDIGQAVENLFNEAIDLATLPPSSPISRPEPTTRRSSSFDLPRLGDDDDREDTLVGVQSSRPPVLSAQKPPPKRGTGFSGLTPAVSPRPIPDAPPIPPRPPIRPRPMTLAFGAQPQRSTTPLGVKPPTLPPPAPGRLLQRTASGNHRIVAPPPSKSPTSDYPEIETFEESKRETRNWGLASDLGTADLDPNKR